MNVVELLAKNPFVFCVVDFEAAVWWDASRLERGQRGGGKQHTRAAGWRWDRFRELELMDIDALGVLAQRCVNMRVSCTHRIQLPKVLYLYPESEWTQTQKYEADSLPVAISRTFFGSVPMGARWSPPIVIVNKPCCMSAIALALVLIYWRGKAYLAFLALAYSFVKTSQRIHCLHVTHLIIWQHVLWLISNRAPKRL